jgi:hypothetical protein
MRLIKYFRLLNQYKPSFNKARNNIDLYQLMRDDKEFIDWFVARVLWEQRYYERLKKLSCLQIFI